MAWREKVAQVLTNHNFDIKLKTEQIETISAVLEGKDVFAQLPTGYGKSLIYTLLPLLMDEIHVSKQILRNRFSRTLLHSKKSKTAFTAFKTLKPRKLFIL